MMQEVQVSLQLFIENFSRTDTTFKGIAEHQYQFYIAAIDSVGNKELPKLAGTVRVTNGEEVICPGGNTTFVAPMGANTYQWQVNDGNGYTNLTEAGIYSGTTSANLTLTGAPTNLYGYRYRAVINGVPSATEYLIKFAMTWEGSVDTAWENPANWSCNSVPDANTDVIINGGKDYYPQVSSNAFARTLKTNNGASVRVKTGFNLTVVK
ncbi:MAG: hypothetical protein EON98_15810 [Chitinophagaceae bacterium]|nr:MAG: hypothetical protein EON98_15810 [Chitinophagaceae bacterium]